MEERMGITQKFQQWGIPTHTQRADRNIIQQEALLYHTCETPLHVTCQVMLKYEYAEGPTVRLGPKDLHRREQLNNCWLAIRLLSLSSRPGFCWRDHRPCNDGREGLEGVDRHRQADESVVGGEIGASSCLDLRDQGQVLRSVRAAVKKGCRASPLTKKACIACSAPLSQGC